MHLFHCPDLGTDTVELTEEEAHHAVSVLRLTVGTRVGLLNGQGIRAEGELIAIGKRGCTVGIHERRISPPERTARIHLAVAPTKQMDRYEWFVEKAVEIGVDRISPLITERTERGKLRMDRLQRVAISAMKQSQRVWLPRIDALRTLKDLICEASTEQRYFGWCEGEPPPLMQRYVPSTDAMLLIGPEGDFTPAEADLLHAASFVAAGLGAARLRTETAAVAACTWMSLAQQR